MPKVAGLNGTKSQQRESKSATRHKPSSSERVVEGVIQTLLTGRYVPGQKLIEAELTRNYQLSRGPIREALKRLSAEGVVVLKAHRGAFIRSFTRQEVYEMLVILETLVGLMARLAAEAVQHGNDPKPVADAYERLAPYKDPGSEDLAYIEQRRNFYEALVAIGGNRQMARATPTIEIHIIRAQTLPFLTPKDRTERQKEYAAITQAVLEGTPRQAERVARKHIAATKKRFTSLPDHAFAAEE